MRIPKKYFEEYFEKIIDLIYPVGSIYMSVSSTNPQTYLGGTWVRWGNGRVPVGVDTSSSNFISVEKTGGEITHKLTPEEIPKHEHGLDLSSLYATTSHNHSAGAYGSNTSVQEASSSRDYRGEVSGLVKSAGGDKAHNNLQPYITCYMWKRTK